MKYQILIVEDQKDIRDIVSKYLEREGYGYYQAKDGFEALDIFNKNIIHLVLLDIMMPGIDGFEVIKEMRRISDVPVIMLTARQEEADRLKGFDTGADDYVIKPFSAKELMKRVRNLIKRIYHDTDEMIYRYGELSLHSGSMKLYKNEKEIKITSAEFNLLLAMFKNQGMILSREQLIRLAFGDDYDGYDRSIDSHIRRIRRKIGENPRNPQVLVTKYGAGYLFGGQQS